jgi:excisionase family DNA binding protein
MDLYLSVADASRILGVTPQAVRLMIRRGTLRVSARTVGGIQLFRREEVERLAAERHARQAAARPAVGPAAEGPA